MKKLVLLFLLSVGYLGNVSSQVRTYYFTDGELFGGFFNAISDNGKYIVGTQPNRYSGLLFVKETEEVIRISSPEEGGNAAAEDVSDDGIIVGLFTDPTALSGDGLNTPCEVPGLYNYKEDKWTALSRPDGVLLYPGSFCGSASSISADGKLIGGYLPTAKKKFVYNGVIWNGDGSIHSILPDSQSGAGAKINSISNDGTVACGWNKDAQYGKIIIWKNGTEVPIHEDGRGTIVSASGKYVGGNYVSATNRDFGVPFIWSEETGIVKIDCPENTFSGQVSGITDDGKIAVGYVDFTDLTNHHPFIIVNNQYFDFDQYMETNYGIKGPLGHSFFTITSIARDGSVMCGYSYIEMNRIPWILVFDKALSIQNEQKELLVDVYPDPESNVLRIKGDYSSAYIYNSTGTCVFTEKRASGYIDVAHLSSGLYIIKVVKDGITRQFKITINH